MRLPIAPTTPATTAARVVRWFAAVATLVGLTACDLPGLRPVGPETSRADADAGPPLCEFGRSKCHGSGRLVCARVGPPRFESCGENETCKNGTCRPLENACDESLPFRLSTRDFAFDSNGELRPDTASFQIERCGDQSLTLAGVGFRQPETPHGRPTFTVDNRVPVDETPIPSDEPFDVKIRYQPQFGFFLRTSPPTATVEVRTRRPYETELRLRRRIDCVTTRPRIDLGAIDDSSPTTFDVPFHNCGNQPARIYADAALPDGTDGSSTEFERPGETPRVFDLRPEESRTIPLTLKPGDEPGPLREKLTFSSIRLGPTDSSRPARTSTTILAHVTGDSCLDEPVPNAAYRRDAPSFAENPEDDPYQTGVDLQIPPFETIWLRTEDSYTPAGNGSGAKNVRLTYRIRKDPRTSRAAVEVDARSTLYRRFQPDVAGTYEIAVRRLAADGRRSCDARAETLTVDVVPEEELYVELTWQSPKDPIPGDRGYGRGADLNLHVLRTDDPPPTDWNDPAHDCFQPGRRITRRCPTGGAIRAASVSGAGAEAIEFDRPRDQSVCVAVHSWNPYRFEKTRARVRVYGNGSLAPTTPMERQFGDRIGTVWFAGCYDGGDDAFIPIDSIRKSF